VVVVMVVVVVTIEVVEDDVYGPGKQPNELG
jgi:hypothetical protein